MAKTPQAKAAQAAVAVKRRKSSGANAARDKPNKGERRASKPEEEEEGKKKDDKQDKDDQADKVAERDGAGNDDRNEDNVAKSASEAKQSPKTGKNAAKEGAAEPAQDKEHPSKADDIAKPSEEEKQESQSKPAPNTAKKRAAAKTDPKTNSSSNDDSKAPPSKKPKKEQRQGTRQSSRSTTTTASAAATNKANGGVAGEGEDETGGSSSRGKPNKAQLLRYLISPEAERLCRPDDEEEALSASDSKITKTYGGPEALSPFEELISAMILSRPISHRLGLRTIRTVLNEPYEFSSAKRVQDAGDEKRHQALWDAKTQHKDKTAAQLGLAGDVVLAKYCHAANTSAAADGKGEKGKSGKGGRKSAAGAGAGGADGDAEGSTLAGLVAQSESDIDDLLATLQSDIKGFGKTAAAIFRRRIQWAWEFAYPYVDERTADGLKDLGLPIRAEPLVDLVEEHWGEMKAAVDKLAGNDEETRKRRAFTIILERATNARLEGKVGDVLAAAAKS